MVDTRNILATDTFTLPRPQIYIRQGAKDTGEVVHAVFHVKHPP